MKRTAGIVALLMGISGCTPLQNETSPGARMALSSSSREETALARAVAPKGSADEGDNSPARERPEHSPVVSDNVPPALPYRGAPLPPTSVTAAKPTSQPSEPTAATPVTARPESRSSESISVTPVEVPSLSLQPAHDAPAHGKPGVRVIDTAVHVVKSQRLHLNFALSDVGPSGVGAMELWYTRDGKEWTMCEAPAKEPPYTVEVDEEGKYGFTLVARSGVGLCKRRPATGDEPQVWVIVDHTAPEVQLLETTPHQSSHSVDLSIHWSAGDKNFGPQPIALYYAEREDGPWQLVATKLPNTGHYVWSTPSSIPGQVFVRVEATDLAGNVSQAQSKAPIVLDRATPTAAILGIEAGR